MSQNHRSAQYWFKSLSARLWETHSSVAARHSIWRSVLLVFLFPIITMLAALFLPGQWRWAQVPFHAVIEALGAAIAIAVSTLMLRLRFDPSNKQVPVAVPLGLLGMGILDGFHAAVPPGNAFVWLHSLATLFGGVLFASVWLPVGRQPIWQGRPLALWVAVVVLFCGTASLLMSGSLPPMLTGGTFTLTAQLLNIFGGILFIAAAVRLNQLYAAQGEINHRLFAMHCVLFGGAGLVFELSIIWDAAWWWWHFLRLLAYGVALIVIVRELVQLNQDQRNTYTLFKNITDNTHALISVKNCDGSYMHVNRRFTELFNNSLEDTIGTTDEAHLPAAQASAIRANDEKVSLQQEPLEFEEEMDFQDGRHVYLSQKFPIFDAYGNVQSIAGISTDITRQKINTEKIEKLAYFDALTGLPNRLLLTDRLHGALDRARRSEKSAALFFMDLDGFKAVNDRLGHASGDILLRQVSERFRELLRGGDTIGRLGGDEFVCLLEDLEKPEYASKLADKLVAALCQPFNISGQEVKIGISIGISLFPGDGEDVDTLLKNADLAMYSAKQRGRARYTYFCETTGTPHGETDLDNPAVVD